MTWAVWNLVSVRLEALLVMWAMWNLVSVLLEAALDRSTVCAKHTIGSKIFWTHPMVLLGDKFQVEARFGPFGDSANPDAR